MLAAAVVVAFVKINAVGRGLVHQHVGARHVAAAAQHLVVLPGFGQHGLGRLHVHVFAVVAGAQHGDFGLGQAKFLRAAGLHKGQRLQGFEGGAGKAHHVRLADKGLQFVTRIDHRQRAKVHAFGQAATAELDEGGEIAGGHTRTFLEARNKEKWRAPEAGASRQGQA